VVFLFLAFGINTDGATREPTSGEQRRHDSNALGKQYWQTIQGITASDPDGFKKGPEAELEYWLSIATFCEEHFDKIAADKSWPESGAVIVDQFGRHDAAADIRWMFALSHEVAERGWAGPVSRNWETFDRDATCIPVSRFLTESALKRPEVVARLWTALAYGRRIIGEGEPGISHHDHFVNFRGYTKQGFDDIHDDKIAWYHVNFLLLAHATGRDDLYKDCKVEQIPERFKSWDSWFLENVHYLKASPDYPKWTLDEDAKQHGRKGDRLPEVKLPTLPFPDWKSPPRPPPPRALSIH
jgi:hypothetical protein